MQKTIIRIIRMYPNLLIIQMENHNANNANLREYSEWWRE